MNTKKLLTISAAFLAVCVSCPAMAGDSAAVVAAAKVEDAFAEVVDASKEAVVVISNKQTRQNRRGPWQQFNDVPDDFFQFFNIPRDNFPRRNNNREPQNTIPEIVGRGSGVIIRDEGYILTNFHVIKDCEYLEVKTSDGTIYDNYEDEKAVEIIGSDEESDLAVIKINGDKKKKFKCLDFADSDKLRVGQWAIAIGAPFDLDYSVTIGCVSQKGRTDLGMSTFDSYIQTDASINPGNSGGPLLNIRGQIIGINQFIVTGGNGSKGSVGIGFAIASNLSKKIADELIASGEVARPFIGVTMQELSRAMKENMNLEYGVLIREVIPGEAAEQAGVKAGDVVLKIGDHKVMTSHELLMEITHYKPGDQIELLIRRDDKDITIKVKAGRRDEYISSTNDNAPRKSGKNGQVELSMKRLGLNLFENEGKVVVQEVLPGGAAEKASLHNDDKIMPGDIIIDINRIPVNNIADIKKALSDSKKNTIIMYLERPNKRGSSYKYFIAINMNDK